MAERARQAGHLRVQAAELGVDLAPQMAERLLDFRDQVVRWNAAFNLVSGRDVGRLVPRHLLDSLSVVPWIAGSQVLDVGTGAGFPGVPLAIAREDAQFTLIDSSERKIRFVRRAVRALGLANVTALSGDVRALAAERVFDTVVCRALADAAAVWRLAGARVAYGGRMVVMSRTRPSEADPRLPADAALERRHPVRIPGLEQPHELILLRRREPATSLGGVGH